ncbi:hypothetical protein FJZ18_01700 [Candidatus Pacearchaeota archaeon]|nr:hypothetical protein [Candidatus Pacearchaeota archaeon]
MHKTRGTYISTKHLNLREIHDRGHIFLQYFVLMFFIILAGTILGNVLSEFNALVWVGAFGLLIFVAIFAHWLRLANGQFYK